MIRYEPMDRSRNFMKKSEKLKMGILIELVTIAIILCVAAGRNYIYDKTVPTMQGENMDCEDDMKSRH